MFFNIWIRINVKRSFIYCDKAGVVTKWSQKTIKNVNLFDERKFTFGNIKTV